MTGADVLGNFKHLARRGIGAPVMMLVMLAMLMLPLPPFLLDMLFSFNIALSLVILLAVVYVMRPLEFAAFPTVVLMATLLRLALNIASTRVVLLHGHDGPGAAGKVIQAFGEFVIGGNFAVGLVVFAIITIINFVVVTKGATRVSEVTARFTLDAMPGKQMAIDADLAAGLIKEDEARRRRKAVEQEADFFGSMDGASKFVRGDAVAGILILFINIIGGLFVGMLQHDMDMAHAAQNYTLLTIGDGLVAQIPALIISTAAGLVVSRVATDEDIGQQFVGQVFANPQVMILTASILGILGLIPGMPHFSFLLFAAAVGSLAYWMLKKQMQPQAEKMAAAPAAALPIDAQEASWADVAPVDVLGLEVGYRLIPLVDKSQDGELLKRIRGLRKKFAQEVGFLSAPVHIRDNLELKPNGYRITLKGVEIGSGEAWPGMFLAINPGRVAGTLPGAQTKDPAFGLPAIWIETGLRDQANALGYTVVDASTVVATHLNHIILSHAAELLGRQETQSLLDHFAQDAPKLIEDLVPKQLPLAVVQRVLQNLLEEGVTLRDLRSIVETLAEQAPRTQDATELTAQVRVALGRSIIQQLYPGNAELSVMALDPSLERVLLQAVQSAGPDGSGIEPGLADTLLKQTAAAAQRQEEIGLPAVLIVPGSLRWLLSRFLRRGVAQLKVIANAEVPDSRTIKVTAIIGGK